MTPRNKKNRNSKDSFLFFFLAICRKNFAIKNGKVIGSGTLEGDKIRFVCNENYLLIGEQVLECKNDGGWSASEPKCKGN